ncbi:M3 family oligoendopeptidase [Planococcus sp. APC 3900]|uniref:M3 family oligoendopeptidase n=1 Tax=Planococcus sp. APC 3900 TaxID=3035191 RepID=UPI0025B536BF|nr:M3 family oligoendopeptidase [Planococcus sp. APC 3900]MDN3439712.1 M3 family oligoendopeptidase [Planococcus sp. APC 3900]
MTVNYPEVWDLDTLFPGGSESQELRQHMDDASTKLSGFEESVQQFEVPSAKGDAQKVADLLEQMSLMMKHLSQSGAFIGCLMAQNTQDKKAAILDSESSSLSARFQNSFQKIQQDLAKTEESVWEELLNEEPLRDFTFVLNEWREEAKMLLSEKEESLITALSVDGYHGWSQLYDMLVGEISVTVTVDGEPKTLSVGQANNLSSHKDAAVRKESYEKLEEAWTDKEEFFAKTLNSIAGFRLETYKKRGWNNPLQEPLHINRMKEETLDAMWGAISKNKQPFVAYLNQKGKLLGKDGLDWYDVDAPVTESTQQFSYQEGAEFILKQFGKFGPELEQFAQQAFEKGWIEAEDRPNKRPGGFCTGLPLSEESRIFMTYSGSMSNVATLAHELGHAFHTYALSPVHSLNRSYAMNVAETASTFAEMIVADAAVKNAQSKEEKIALLEDKVQRSVAFFMNIHSRFLFETRFYEERKNGVVPASRLNELMEQAQKEGFAGGLASTHPHFWASKLHFYITYVPFYNFPYTFGYLFSLSVYAKAIEEGTGFEEKYMALLRDTAVMSAEDLAMKHLGEDITQQAFWEKGIALCVQDAEEFISLTSAEV